MEDADSPTIQTLNCPYCGQTLDVTLTPVAQQVQCPNCNDFFVVPGLDGSTELPGERERQEEYRKNKDDELSGMHIRNIAVARRAAIRGRSYALIAMWGCLIAIGQLIWMIVREIRADGLGIFPILYGLLIALAGWGVVFFNRRARALAREIEGSALEEPGTPPDFTPLSDGSHRLKNLEDIH